MTLKYNGLFQFIVYHETDDNDVYNEDDDIQNKIMEIMITVIVPTMNINIMIAALYDIVDNGDCDYVM